VSRDSQLGTQQITVARKISRAQRNLELFFASRLFWCATRNKFRIFFLSKFEWISNLKPAAQGGTEADVNKM
jgi:hypothetical protein